MMGVCFLRRIIYAPPPPTHTPRAGVRRATSRVAAPCAHAPRPLPPAHAARWGGHAGVVRSGLVLAGARCADERRRQASDRDCVDDHEQLPCLAGPCAPPASLSLSLRTVRLLTRHFFKEKEPSSALRLAPRQQGCLGLAYDELADLVADPNLEPALTQWISEHIAAEFADRYLNDTEAFAPAAIEGPPPAMLAFNLDGQVKPSAAPRLQPTGPTHAQNAT